MWRGPEPKTPEQGSLVSLGTRVKSVPTRRRSLSNGTPQLSITFLVLAPLNAQFRGFRELGGAKRRGHP